MLVVHCFLAFMFLFVCLSLAYLERYCCYHMRSLLNHELCSNLNCFESHSLALEHTCSHMPTSTHMHIHTPTHTHTHTHTHTCTRALMRSWACMHAHMCACTQPHTSHTHTHASMHTRMHTHTHTHARTHTHSSVEKHTKAYMQTQSRHTPHAYNNLKGQ